MDLDMTFVQMSMYWLMAEYCNCRAPLDSAIGL